FDFSAGQFLRYSPKALLFVCVTALLMFAFGLYRRDAVVSASVMIPRLLVAFATALLLLTLLFYSLPASVICRSLLVTAMLPAFVGIIVVRRFGRSFFDSHLLKRRIAVFGAGMRATRIETLNRQAFASFSCVGYMPINGEEVQIPQGRLLHLANDPAELL